MSNLPVGSSQTLVATLDPKDAVVTVVWASDNEAVAVVNEEGAVTGVTPGTAVITASVDKEKATCKVIVTAAKATKIEIDPASLRMEKGSTAELKVVATPSDAALTDLVWSSDDKNVATVADGVVTAVAVGKATIMAVCNGGQLAAVGEDPFPRFLFEHFLGRRPSFAAVNTAAGIASSVHTFKGLADNLNSQQ